MPSRQRIKGEVMDKSLTLIKLFKFLNTFTHINIEILRDKYYYSGEKQRYPQILWRQNERMGVPLYNPAPLPRNISQGN